MNFIKIKVNYILRLFKKILHPSFSPNRDWLLLLALSFFVALVFLSINSFLFFEIYKGNLLKLKTIDQSSLDVINKNKLEEVVNSFEEKNKRSEYVKSEISTFTDPAI